MLVGIIEYQHIRAKLALRILAAFVSVFVYDYRNLRQRARQHQRLISELLICRCAIYCCAVSFQGFRRFARVVEYSPARRFASVAARQYGDRMAFFL
jgi:hypothetical protein